MLEDNTPITNSTKPTKELPAATPEPVWTFRGYTLRPSEFTTAMVHFYRGELQRSNTWRTRLDNTTYWAVITASAGISFVLSEPTRHYGIIILVTLLVTLFLWIEARRYRYYELWSYRVRLMETDFFAAMLVPPFGPQPDWAESLANTLIDPEFPISLWEALGRRFRRNYMWIFIILACAWLLKTFLYPTPATSWNEVIARAALGPIGGETILMAGIIYNGILFAIGLLTAGLTQASGEVLPKFDKLPLLSGLWSSRKTAEAPAASGQARVASWRPPRRRRQFLAFVVTTRPQNVTERVLKEMQRGATVLPGRGAYSQQERGVLLVAVTLTEVPHLKSLISDEDPGAFVVITPAQEVLGRGFQPLTTA